jgi:hypothetical protein
MSDDTFLCLHADRLRILNENECKQFDEMKS